MNIYVYSDESGVFDKEHNDVFVFAGLIMLGSESKEKWSRKYSAVEKITRKNEGLSTDCELKASKITNKAKGKLFRSLNDCEKFCGIINQEEVLDQIFTSKKDKQRYLDYAHKITVKRAFELLIENEKINPESVDRLYFYIDEHTTATNGRYELKEGLEQKFKFGTYNWRYDKYFPPIFPNVKQAIEPHLSAVSEGAISFGQDRMKERMDTLVDALKETVKQGAVAPVANAYGATKGTLNRMEKQIDREIENEFDRIQGDYLQKANIAKAELDKQRKEAETFEEAAKAEETYHSSMEDALKAFTETAKDIVDKTIKEKPRELVEQMERQKAEAEKKTIEDTVRDHLRGFSRTIPSFIMAYGDGHLTLANFDAYTEDDIFEEVTGITEEDFRFLRDGGDYTDPDTGKEEHFAGHLFDEVVFDDSIEEFWHKKQELADYFDESHEEDIFDYIPPQKTNQIVTYFHLPVLLLKERLTVLPDRPRQYP